MECASHKTSASPPPAGLEPVVNRTRCEGKEDCVRVCPKSVFQIGVVSLEERAQLHLGARLKLWIHGGKQAYATNAAACDACGECVKACPEKAITLRARA